MKDNQFEYFENICRDINLLCEKIDCGQDEEALIGLKKLIDEMKSICEKDDEDIIN